MAWLKQRIDADPNPFPEIHLFPNAERVVQTAGSVLKLCVSRLPFHPINHATERVRGAEEFLSECFARDDGEALEPREL